MTTTITVQSHNYPARVRTIDRYDGNISVNDRVLRPEDGAQTFHCTTTRTLEIVDLEYGGTIAEHEKHLTFGDAVEALKAGKRVARAGWNGKGMFLLLVPGSKALTVDAGRPLAKAGIPVGTTFDYLPHIDLWTAQGNFVPWNASQADVLADDWQTVPASA